MPRKPAKSESIATDVAPAAPVSKTAPKKSPVPRASKAVATSAAKSNGSAATAAKSAPSYDDIARCAYLKWQSGCPGGELDHWIAAERELRG
ncbi:MAG: DUF2934 domain-containing protein [Tepidisphaeraceae bacterium]